MDQIEKGQQVMGSRILRPQPRGGFEVNSRVGVVAAPGQQPTRGEPGLEQVRL